MRQKILQVIVYKIVDLTKEKTSPRMLAEYLSGLGRKAVLESAMASGLIPPSMFMKDGRGAPLPENEVWWGLSHKPKIVAGAASILPVGLDVEILRPVSPKLMHKVAANDELGLFGDCSDLVFFKIWTAKEAVLKATGEGLSGFSQCRLSSVVSADHVIVDFRGEKNNVILSVSDTYVVAVCSEPEKVVFTYRSIYRE